MNNYTTLSTSIHQYAATTTRAGVGIWDLQAGKLKKILAYSMHSAHVTNAVLNKAGDKAISSENGYLLCNMVSSYVTLAISLANGAHILIFTLVIQNKIEHMKMFFYQFKIVRFFNIFLSIYLQICYTCLLYGLFYNHLFYV